MFVRRCWQRDSRTFNPKPEGIGDEGEEGSRVQQERACSQPIDTNRVSVGEYIVIDKREIYNVKARHRGGGVMRRG